MRLPCLPGLLVAVVLYSSQSVLAECVMKPPPLDVARIARRPEVLSHTVDANRLGLTALLRNGRAVRLVHMGCAHSGAKAALWLESEIPASDVAKWIKEAVILSKIAFAIDIAKDIERSLMNGNFEKEVTDARLVINASPTEYFSYSIVLSPAEHGLILSVEYVLG